MNMQPVISVRGEASLEVEPELAFVNVTIQARDRDRQTVLSRLASRNQHVTALVKGYGEAVDSDRQLSAAGRASLPGPPRGELARRGMRWYGVGQAEEAGGVAAEYLAGDGGGAAG